LRERWDKAARDGGDDTGENKRGYAESNYHGNVWGDESKDVGVAWRCEGPRRVCPSACWLH
jgi:hypothetical protein